MAAKRLEQTNSQHPSPTAILISVSTSPLPRFGIIHSLALYMSYPAANALPLVGTLALSESFLTNSGGEAESGGGGALVVVEEEAIGSDCSVLGRLARGEVGREGGA